MSGNLKNPKAPEKEACLTCKDLLIQLQRFFDVLQSVRRPYDSDWLTVDDIAEELRISKNVVYRSIRTGELEAVDIAETNGRVAQRGHYRIRRSSLNEYLEAKKVKAPPGDPVRTSRAKRFPKVKNHLGL